jgi:vacuolar-type H+-ATPase subunit H
MKLSEVFSSLLSAEDQAVEYVSNAKNEALRLRRNTRVSFEDKRKTALDAAHGFARAVIDSARQRGEKEAIEIMTSGESERYKITELYEKNVDALMTALADEIAEECVTRARSYSKHNEGPSA